MQGPIVRVLHGAVAIALLIESMVHCYIDYEYNQGNCFNVDITSRKDWGSVMPAKVTRLQNPVDRVVFKYCRLVPRCEDGYQCMKTLTYLESLDKFYPTEKLEGDINQYNFMIGEAGTYEIIGWNSMGPQQHETNITIGYIGGFMQKPESFLRTISLIMCGVEKGLIRPTFAFVRPDFRSNFDKEVTVNHVGRQLVKEMSIFRIGYEKKDVYVRTARQ